VVKQTLTCRRVVPSAETHMLHEHVPHGSPNLLGHARRRKLSADQASQRRGVRRVVGSGYGITVSDHLDPRLCQEI
jgi:hypothetical protein